MWDTGATASLISDKIATELQLKDVGFTQIRHVAGTATFPIYTAAVDIRNGIKISEHRLISFPGADTFDMIIGMDIITLGNFCIENRNGDSIFSFSKETYS
ncbi:MAG: retroviral-like aspartic protease family protein [Chitinispirillales bacterium]|nr:retroviral-like aspartic protease family protein [Chitinispirillales bacterium]